MKGKLKNARGGRIKEEKINKISPSIFLTIFFNQKKKKRKRRNYGKGENP
jgi:hypothetical protein